jgi:hypothetical protein
MERQATGALRSTSERLRSDRALAGDGRKLLPVIATDSSLDALALRAQFAALTGAQRCPVEFATDHCSPRQGCSRATACLESPYIAFDDIALSHPAYVTGSRRRPLQRIDGPRGDGSDCAWWSRGARAWRSAALEVDERRASLVAEMVMSAGCYIDIGSSRSCRSRAIRFCIARLNIYGR